MAVIYITEADRTLHKFRLPEDPSVVVTIGREESCAISLPTILGLSGLHCSIVRVEDTYVMTDEGSTNGTYEGERAISSEPLRAGAVYSIGNAALTFDPEIPAVLPVDPVEPEMEAPAAPAEPIVRDDVVVAVPEEEAPAAPAPGASRSKRDLILPGVLLAAGIGMGAYAAWLACADMGKQTEHLPLAQEEVQPSEGASAPDEQAGKVSHVGHIACGSRVDSIVFSPDSRALITQGDKQVRMWDVRTGKPLCEPMPCAAEKLGFLFSPDGKCFITSDDERTLRVRDARTGKAIGEPLIHGGAVGVVLFSPDGSRIATGAAGGMVRLWESSTAKLLLKDMWHGGPILQMLFSPDGSQLVSVSADKTACLWSMRGGQRIGEPVRLDSPGNGLAFSPDGTQYAVYLKRDVLQRVDAKSGMRKGDPLKLGALGYNAPTYYSDDSSVLYTRGGIFDARTGEKNPPRQAKQEATAKTPDEGGAKPMIVSGILFFVDKKASEQTGKRVLAGEPVRSCVGAESMVTSPDGKLVAMIRGGDDEVFFAAVPTSAQEVKRLQDKATEQAKARVPRWKVESKKLPLQEGAAVTLSPDGSLYAMAQNNQAQLYDARSGAAVGAAMLHDVNVTQLAFCPDGKLFASAAEDKAVRFWDARSGQPAGEALQHDKGVQSMQFSPDGSVLATVDAEGTLRLWDVRTGKVRGEELKYSSRWLNLVFSPDGKSLVSHVSGGAAHLWNTRSGKAANLGEEQKCTSVAFSPDSKRFALAEGNVVRLYNARSAQPVGEPMEHEANAAVVSLSFSPDGKLLATTPARGGVVQVWDTRTCQPKGKALRHGTAYFWRFDAAVFSPNGKRLVVSSQYGESGKTLYLWDVASGTCIGDTAGHPGLFRMTPSPDGAFVSCGTNIWDADDFSMAELAEGSEDVTLVWSVQQSADGRTMLIGTDGGYYLMKVTEK